MLSKVTIIWTFRDWKIDVNPKRESIVSLMPVKIAEAEPTLRGRRSNQVDGHGPGANDVGLATVVPADDDVGLLQVTEVYALWTDTSEVINLESFGQHSSSVWRVARRGERTVVPGPECCAAT